MKEFFKELISIKEDKKSIVALCLMLISLAAIYMMLFKNGDIPEYASTVIITLSGCICGVNGIDGISNLISKIKDKATSAMPNNDENKSI